MTKQAECTQLDLMRHGETLTPRAVCGVTDVALSEQGWRQMREKVDRLLKTNELWDGIFHSPLLRCAEFAHELEQRYQIPTQSMDDLREIDFGCWEGLEFEVLSRRYPGQWEAWMTQSTGEAPHGGENFLDFKSRVGKSFDILLNERKGKRLLLLIHGGVARAIMAHTLGLNPEQLFRISFGHACVSRISAYHKLRKEDWFQLDAHNFV